MKTSKPANPWKFFALALSISWFFWMWVILLDWNVFTFPAIILGALGLFGPAIAEIILISRTHDKEEWRDYWQRVFDIRRIGKRWHLVIWLTFPVLNTLALLLSVLTGSPWPEFETARNLLSEPWRILPFAIFILLYGPLPEELGWRGYALDGLQARYNALFSSLILGAVWALWHFPLFFMEGQWQHDVLKFGTLDFWTFIFSPIFLSILFTWIYNNTNRSTLSAILFHFMCNFSGNLIPLTERGRLYSLILTIILSMTVTLIFGPETLTRNRKGCQMRSTEKGILERFLGRGVCPYQLSFILDSPFRRLILSPQRLADRLHLKEDSRVLEIGPGSGYFSVEVARRIPHGHLELFDIQQEMLEKAHHKIESAGLNNVGFTRGDAVDLPFDEGEFDVVFLVAVLGEVSDPEACLRSIYKVLRPSGLLSITEQPGDPDFLPQRTVIAMAEKQGFKFVESYGGKRNYTANFRKPVPRMETGKSDIFTS
ncbi:methyltransferase domain-containing protein [Thermococcus sp. 5-4]|uniref:methyltransferase domain-containing protein n=1 Tax=Thermococcus sp. 5-4 TaxID=2008440 RepID=UPI0011AB7653|nr:methyltransferase domain-containing protein [Thermococcus sp. 5-4]